jgi:hypothetical protein
MSEATRCIFILLFTSFSVFSAAQAPFFKGVNFANGQPILYAACRSVVAQIPCYLATQDTLVHTYR